MNAGDLSAERNAGSLEIGVCILPADIASTEHHAVRLEEAGAGWLGVCDSPIDYADPTSVMHAALAATSSLRIGTLVTNPVTRHWSAQAGAYRTLDEVGPDRAFMGISTGDAAVLDAGLKPARIEELASYVARFREVSPSTRVLVAAGGPKSVRRAATYADQVVLGQGFSCDAVEPLLGVIDAACETEGRSSPPAWLFVIASLVSAADDQRVAMEDIRETALGQAAQAFSGSLTGRGVDPEFGERIKAYFRSASGEDAEVEKYLLDRYAVGGTPEEVAERVLEAVENTGLRRVFIALISEQMERVVRLATSRMIPRLVV